jgi:hypothetical protein
VLRWIREGCPDGRWTDFTYKTTASALQSRRLVEVSKRGGTWSASMSPAGDHYLVNGCYPPGHWTKRGGAAVDLWALIDFMSCRMRRISAVFILPSGTRAISLPLSPARSTLQVLEPSSSFEASALHLMANAAFAGEFKSTKTKIIGGNSITERPKRAADGNKDA